MSQTDSFIEEVTEEVKRDRLFALIRRYGWIAVLLVLAIVGGAAWNEVQKSQATADAQASGDMIIAAVEADTDVAFADVKTPSANAQIVSDMLYAAQQVAEGETGAAADTFDGIALSGGDTPAIYRDIATFKAILARGSDMPMDDRRAALEALASPGAPLALLAQEQLALTDIEAGDTEAAIARLNEVLVDASATAGLRRRASQLIVALGGTPSDAVN